MWQVATHLKSLVKKAKLNEGHVKAARVYKLRVASLISERTELWDRVQRMTEETLKLKSDLKHTSSASARTEGREDEARNSLRAAEDELREVRDELWAAQNDLLEAKMGCSLHSMSFKWLGMSFLHPKASCGSLKKSFVRLKINCAIRQRCWTGFVVRLPRLRTQRNA